MRFKELRIKNNLTQMDIAKYLGITRAAYTNIENGKRETDYKTLDKLARLFNVSIDYLLQFSDEKKEFNADESAELSEFLQDPKCKEIFDRLIKLNDQNLEIALAALDGIINHQDDPDK